MSSKLEDFVLGKEKDILKEIGHELTKNNSDQHYPDTYYKSYEYNIYEEMLPEHKKQYGEGSGGELRPVEKKGKYKPAKMASIRSSSAMTFNLLGNYEIELKKDNALSHTGGRYRIIYEKKLETIVSGKRPTMANLDAFLVSSDGTELIFCEMKMMEWFRKNNAKLNPAYTRKENYSNPNLYPLFLKVMRIIEAKEKQGDFEHYDVWQMFKHTLAIYNYLETNKNKNIKRVTLVNVVFEPKPEKVDETVRMEYIKQVESEKKGFNSFISALAEGGILQDGGSFFIIYLSAEDFINSFEINDEKKQYLRRYTL